MHVVFLNVGWEDEDFETILQTTINKKESVGLKYYDIKISSKGNHCLVIFKKKKLNVQ